MDRKVKILTSIIGKEEIINRADSLKIEKQLAENEIGFLLFKKEDLSYFYENYDSVITYLSELAKNTQTEIITGILYIKIQESLMEQSVYIGKNGEVLGEVCKEFDKQQLSHSIQFQEFHTSIGIVGIVLGKDLWSVEIPRILALKGAVILFAPDIQVLDQECEEQHILGIAIYNCLNIIYCRQENENSRFIFVSSEEVKIQKDIDFEESVICEVDLDKIDIIRKPDLTFKNTMWWLLYGRRPQKYKDILTNYCSKEEQ